MLYNFLLLNDYNLFIYIRIFLIIAFSDTGLPGICRTVIRPCFKCRPYAGKQQCYSKLSGMLLVIPYAYLNLMRWSQVRHSSDYSQL